jgi:hypothetical protein
MNYNDSFVGAEGLNYPVNGKPIFHEDFAEEHAGLFDEISGRESDLFSAGILFGFSCSISGTSIIITPGAARDPFSRRIRVQNDTTIEIPNGHTVRIVVRHKWASKNYTPDGSSDEKTRRSHSFEFAALIETDSISDGDVPLWKITRAGTSLTINEDLRSKVKSRVSFFGGIPIGGIIPYLPGYFTTGSNGGFFNVALALPDELREANGALCFDIDSPLFNGTGRYLPNLTDNRFLSGSNAPGSVGGQNSFQLTTANLPPHTHSITHDHGSHLHSGWSGGMTSGNPHSHGLNNVLYNDGDPYDGVWQPGAGTIYRTDAKGRNPEASNVDHGHAIGIGGTNISYTGNSSDGAFSNSSIENRPLYLTCKYLIRIK